MKRNKHCLRTESNLKLEKTNEKNPKKRGGLQYKLVVRHCLKCNGSSDGLNVKPKNFKIKILLYFQQTVNSLQSRDCII